MQTKYIYSPIGVCCKEITVVLEDNKMVDISFQGGCPGNLNALKTLMLDKPYTEFLGVFEHNRCGSKINSCMRMFNFMLTLIDKDIKGEEEYPYTKECV